MTEEKHANQQERAKKLVDEVLNNNPTIVRERVKGRFYTCDDCERVPRGDLWVRWNENDFQMCLDCFVKATRGLDPSEDILNMNTLTVDGREFRLVEQR